MATAKNNPTKTAEAAGTCGHTYIFETDTQFNIRAGANPAPIENPGKLTYTTGVATEPLSMTMAREREDPKLALETSHTKEDVTNGLRKASIDSVPKELVVELKEEYVF